MYKIIVLVLAASLCLVSAAPKPGVLAAYAAAPVVPGVVTATSSQVIARNYNTLAAPLVAAAPAPFVAAAPAPYFASPYVAAPYVAPAYSPYLAAPTVVV